MSRRIEQGPRTPTPRTPTQQILREVYKMRQAQAKEEHRKFVDPRFYNLSDFEIETAAVVVVGLEGLSQTADNDAARVTQKAHQVEALIDKVKGSTIKRSQAAQLGWLGREDYLARHGYITDSDRNPDGSLNFDKLGQNPFFQLNPHLLEKLKGKAEGTVQCIANTWRRTPRIIKNNLAHLAEGLAAAALVGIVAFGGANGKSVSGAEGAGTLPEPPTTTPSPAPSNTPPPPPTETSRPADTSTSSPTAKPPTPPPSPTTEPSPTSPATATSSATATNTPTLVPTATATERPTDTATATQTATTTATGTPTPELTSTATVTSTVTSSVTATSSATFTATGTATLMATGTSTPALGGEKPAEPSLQPAASATPRSAQAQPTQPAPRVPEQPTPRPAPTPDRVVPTPAAVIVPRTAEAAQLAEIFQRSQVPIAVVNRLTAVVNQAPAPVAEAVRLSVEQLQQTAMPPEVIARSAYEAGEAASVEIRARGIIDETAQQKVFAFQFLTNITRATGGFEGVSQEGQIAVVAVATQGGKVDMGTRDEALYVLNKFQGVDDPHVWMVKAIGAFTYRMNIILTEGTEEEQEALKDPEVIKAMYDKIASELLAEQGQIATNKGTYRWIRGKGFYSIRQV